MTESELPGITALISDIECNMWEKWSNDGRGPGCTLHDEGDATRFTISVIDGETGIVGDGANPGTSSRERGITQLEAVCPPNRI